MRAPKWLVIAKNEYRLSTSGIRRIRRYFPYLISAILVVYVLYLAPMFMQLFTDEFLALLLSQAAVAIVQIVMFAIFAYFIVIPITNTLRESQVGQLEIVLKAPVRPSDVLVGEYVGRIPFYTAITVGLAGTFAALLTPIGVDALQIAIIVLIMVITVLSAFWIGHLIAAVLGTRFGKTARGKDIGRALSMVAALPLVAIMYAMIGGGVTQALADPETGGIISALLGVLPSSWGGDVIVSFAANPGNIAASSFEMIPRLGGLIVFFVAVIWLGAKVADRIYSLEPPSFSTSVVKPEGVFYRGVRGFVGGGSFGTLVVSVLKDFGRRLESISRIAYVVGLLVLIQVFLSDPGPEGGFNFTFEMNPIFVAILALFVASEVTIRGKENLFIIRKAPRGVERFVKARLIQGCIVLVPIVTLISAYGAVTSPEASTVSVAIFISMSALIAAANVALVLGVFLLNPAFSIKSPNYGINFMIVMVVSFGIFLALTLGLFRDAFSGGSLDALLYSVAAHTVLILIVGLALLMLGIRKLGHLE
jgi:hypothetical protein